MASSYSLLIYPSLEMKRYLDELIQGLSEKYKSPNFEAHITLLSGINSDEKTVIQETKRFASIINVMSLQLDGISFSTTYFQSVFVRVKPTAQLMEANLEAKRIFHVDNNVFMPHISLLYGNQDMRLRETAAAEIVLPETKQFLSESVAIVKDCENIEDEKPLAVFPLQTTLNPNLSI